MAGELFGSDARVKAPRGLSESAPVGSPDCEQNPNIRTAVCNPHSFLEGNTMTPSRLFQLGIVALLSFVAGVLLASPHHLNVALGLLPGIMLANGPIALDLKAVVENITASFKELKADHATALSTMQQQLDGVEARANRQGLGGVLHDEYQPLVVRATSAERKAFEDFLKTGDKSRAPEGKAMTVGSNADGGYAVPTWFDAEVYQIARGATPLLDLVKKSVVRNFPARHIVSLGNAAEGWVGETLSRPATNTPQIAVVENQGGDLYANPQLSQWAIDDMNFKVTEWLASEVGLRFAESIQGAIVGGNGISKPKGFLAATLSLVTDQAGRPFGEVQYLKTGVAGGLPATTIALIDFLLNVVHSLKQSYRQNAGWLMNSTTLGELRKAKDTTNRPVLLDSLINGQPATLLGFPVYEVSDMPDLAANALPIAFGDWKRGYALDEHQAGLRVIIDQVTNKPYVGFYSLRRLGGNVLDSNAIKIVKCMV